MSTIEYSCGHQVSAHSGQAMPMQCACGEGEIVGAKGQFYMTAKPLQVDEWNGTGLPPVGTECEAVLLEDPEGGGRDFERVIIKGYWEKQVWFCTAGGEDFTHLLADVDFLPIRTQAQREREEVVETAHAIIVDARAGSTLDDVLQALYDAGMLRRAGE